MKNYLFVALLYLLLFLLMCGTLCGHVSAAGVTGASDSENTADLFKNVDLTKAIKPGGESAKTQDIQVTVNDYYSPVILSTNSFLVALAGVNRMGETGKKITVLTKYINMKSNKDWRKNLFTTPDNDGKWSTQLAAYDNCDETSCKDTSVVRGFVAAAKKEKIYLLMVNASAKAQAEGNSLSGLWLISGETSNDKTPTNEQIVWKTTVENLPNVDKFNTLVKAMSQVSLVDCSAFVMDKEEKIFFVVKSQDKDHKKTISAFINLKDPQDKFELSNVMSGDGFYSFFQWEDKIFRTPTGDQSSADKEVMVLNGNEFTESKSSIARLRDLLTNKNNFATATVGENNDNVLLFTQQKDVDEDKNVYLWMCDGNRSSKVGTIITNIESTETFYASFLYTNKELFVLYQKYKLTGPEENNKKVVFTLLAKEMDNITKTLTAWKGGNDKIKELCEDLKNTVTPCYTDGLVGFLSNKSNESSTEWIDEYFYENATVTQGTKDSGGFTFSRGGAGAKWQVGKKQEGDQPYNFIYSGFTLVATVKIDENNKETTDNSLLGLVLTGVGSGSDNKRIGLLCNTEKKWVVTVGNNEIVKNAAKQCEQGTAYSVALVLEGTKLLVYVDWEKITDLNDNIKIQNSDKIEHFYFGADTEGAGGKTDKTYATITNVLLYNRPFTEEKEISELKVKQNEIDNRRKIENKKSGSENEIPRNNGSTEQTDALPTTSTTQKNDTKEESSSPPTTEDSAAVDVLSLLFGVFTLLGRHVY